ncbi:MAG: PHB depolymerase family esterase [Bacteroidota bacterium]
MPQLVRFFGRTLQRRVLPLLLFALLTAYAALSFAQQKHVFTSGLVIRSGAGYGREALYTDPVAYALYTNTLATPVEGMAFGKDKSGNDLKWTKISADTAGRFRGRGGAGNYVYFEYDAAVVKPAVLNIIGNATVFINGEPHMGDPYASGWMNVPFKMKKGKNAFLVRGQGVEASLSFPERAVYLDVRDATVPSILFGSAGFGKSEATELKAAVVVVNSSASTLKNLQIKSKLAGKELTSMLPEVLPYSTRKVYFSFSGAALDAGGASTDAAGKAVALVDKVVGVDGKTVGASGRAVSGNGKAVVAAVGGNGKAVGGAVSGNGKAVGAAVGADSKALGAADNAAGMEGKAAGVSGIVIGPNDCALSLLQGQKVLDQKTLKIERVPLGDKYSRTFISGIDGSLQYYAVAPKTRPQGKGAALFFSVHGAGVEAIGQARAYKSKDWGDLVTPTNRRPRGFNWEDWGRLDALEVLAIAKETLQPDPQRVYLTGHSMGGHGTWFLGATYPDKWAAMAPCAGYPTLKGYGSADGLIPDSSASALGQVLLRSSNQSDVPKLAYNYKQLGVYILHGDADETVSVKYARQMKAQLAGFHADLSYYEYPGGSHWYGDHSVDWLPIFDFFKWHQIPLSKAVNTIDFTTASPGISASNHWIGIQQQLVPLQYSRVNLNRDLIAGKISGTTENVALLKIALADFGQGKAVEIQLDGLNTLKYSTSTPADSLFLEHGAAGWSVVKAPSIAAKGPHRYGTFKEGFNKNMLYVYGTGGTKAEQEWSIAKARFDAESWYYRGNGAFDIIADKDYSKAKYAGRNVVLIGNSQTNSSWKTLLGDCPVKVLAGSLVVGGKKWTGDDLATYFIWPIAGTAANTVSVISGTGLPGMKAANANQYFAGGSGFPDIMVFRLKMLTAGIDQVEYAGFYDNNWQLK